MISQKNIEKLKRFLNDEANESEKYDIYSLFSNNENNPEFEELILNTFFDYLANHPEEEQDLIYLLDRIHHITHTRELKAKKSFMQKIYRYYLTAAAVLFIPLLFFIGYAGFKKVGHDFLTESATTTLIAPLGSRVNFTLPDGTQGWLNSGSSLLYNIPFKNKREVTLSGEGWFNVAKDINHPFEINTGKSKLRVVGTVFNVTAYPLEQYVEVVIEEGKVVFMPDLNSEVDLNTSERMIYVNDSVFVTKTDTEKYTAWKEGKLVFRDDEMPEVVRRIERWYNIEMELVDEDLKDDIIRGTFQDDSLEDVLHFLSMTSLFKYRILDRKIENDGNLLRKKVLVYRN